MSFTAYIMSIVGVVCLTTLIDVFIADGETKKYVKGIAALLVFAVIIYPIPKLVNSDFDIAELFDTESRTASVSEFDAKDLAAYDADTARKEALCVESLSKHGYEGVFVSVYEITGYNGKKIEKVVAIFTNAVISPEKKNIDIIADITEIIETSINVDGENITIAGLDYE